MRKLIIITALLLLSLPIMAQDTYYTIYAFDGFIPEVTINERSHSLQKSLLPTYYLNHSVRTDMKWVQEHSANINLFWEAQGDSLLHVMSELAGIKWYESQLEIYFVRYHQSLGSGDPLILPIGGMRKGTLVEVMPDDTRQILNLAYQLAHRLLDQTIGPNNKLRQGIADHPLMRPSAFRRDNLAMLLAVASCESVIGIDTARAAFESAFWKNNMVGRKIYKKYLETGWILTPDNTLADWIRGEGWSSPMVKATRPARPEKRDNLPRSFVEGLPLKGELGFSAQLTSSGLLRIDKIDLYRLAYANGLREGDMIRRVDGARARSHKSLVEKLLAGLEIGGSTLEIMRDNQNLEIILQPMMLPMFEGDEYPEEENIPDENK